MAELVEGTALMATWGVRLCSAYLLAGLIFAIPFVLVGAGRIDPAARHGTWGFRLLILPGAAALWPLLAWRWVTSTGSPPVEGNAHRRGGPRPAGGEKWSPPC